MMFSWRLPSPRGVLVWAATAFALLFVYSIREYLLPAISPFLFAILLAYLLEPFVAALQRKRVPRIVAILVMYAFVAFMVFMFGAFVVPTIVEEVNSLVKQVPDLVTKVQTAVWDLQEQYSRINLPPAVTEAINNNLLSLQNYLLSLLNGIPQFIFGLLSKSVTLILIPILSFYMLKDLDDIKRGLVRLVPTSRRARVVALFGNIDDTLGAWIRGQLTVGFVVGFLTVIGLEIVGMDFSLMLGTIVGLTNIIPYFGPIIGGAPAVALALLRSPGLMLKVLVVLVISQQIESNFITPQILGKQLGLHPLIIIFALLLGAQFGGLLGLIFAVPVAAVIKVLIEFCADLLL
jgi:predicted PurR-regulated permease PerM